MGLKAPKRPLFEFLGAERAGFLGGPPGPVNRQASIWRAIIFQTSIGLHERGFGDKQPGMPSWNPALYLSFADQRTRPAAELLARVPGPDPQSIIDLGCGPGNSTALLAARWPNARLEGLDSSAAMLE